MSRLRVLVTCQRLDGRSGVEMYVRDLTEGLLERGHLPIVYTPCPGPLAETIRDRTIPVVDDLTLVGTTPDIIHGQHNIETMTALLHFPRVPALFVCHGNRSWQEVPPRSPRLARYVAVDQTCRDRLVSEYGVAEDRVRVIYNGVDLARFTQRGPLPARPARALIFSNYADDKIPVVREACERTGMTLDVVGERAGTRSERPEAILGQYDLVFAKARCALEAMAVGTAVILCDFQGLGPMVTRARLDELRLLNFGHRALGRPVEVEALVREIERYDPADAAEVSKQIRESAGCDVMLEELIALYREVIHEYGVSGPPDPLDEGRAAAAYLRWLSLWIRREQDAILSSATIRIRNRLRRIPLASRLARFLARRLG